MSAAWEPDYEWYSKEWGGTASEDDFDRGIKPAVSRVAYLIGFNEPTEDDYPALKDASCAALDAYLEWGDGPCDGFTIGTFSVSGNGQDVGTAKADASVRGILLKTGLLFQGVR